MSLWRWGLVRGLGPSIHQRVQDHSITPRGTQHRTKGPSTKYGASLQCSCQDLTYVLRDNHQSHLITVACPLKGLNPGHTMCVLLSCIARPRGQGCIDEVNLPQFDTELFDAAMEKDAWPTTLRVPSIIGHICNRQRESGDPLLFGGAPQWAPHTLVPLFVTQASH